MPKEKPLRFPQSVSYRELARLIVRSLMQEARFVNDAAIRMNVHVLLYEQAFRHPRPRIPRRGAAGRIARRIIDGLDQWDAGSGFLNQFPSVRMRILLDVLDGANRAMSDLLYAGAGPRHGTGRARK